MLTAPDPYDRLEVLRVSTEFVPMIFKTSNSLRSRVRSNERPNACTLYWDLLARARLMSAALRVPPLYGFNTLHDSPVLGSTPLIVFYKHTWFFDASGS